MRSFAQITDKGSRALRGLCGNVINIIWLDKYV